MVWLAEHPLMPGRSYLFKLGTRTVSGSVTRIRHRIDVNSFEHVPAETIGMNEVALVSVALLTPIAVEPSRATATRRLHPHRPAEQRHHRRRHGRTVAEAATDVAWHDAAVDKRGRAALKGQKPAVLWFTGLSGSGKSTIANLVEQRLHALGRHTILLDGDNMRHGLNRDLGFSDADRVENIRRAAETARLMTEAGLIVLASFISPYRSDRAFARERMAEGEFIEVFVDTPVADCRRRDPKGLYRRADAG